MTRILRPPAASPPRPPSKKPFANGTSPHKPSHDHPQHAFPYPVILAIVESRHMLSELVERVCGVEHPVGVLGRLMNLDDIMLFGSLSIAYTLWASAAHHLSPVFEQILHLLRKLLKGD